MLISDDKLHSLWSVDVSRCTAGDRYHHRRHWGEMSSGRYHLARRVHAHFGVSFSLWMTNKLALWSLKHDMQWLSLQGRSDIHCCTECSSKRKLLQSNTLFVVQEEGRPRMEDARDSGEMERWIPEGFYRFVFSFSQQNSKWKGYICSEWEVRRVK